MPIPTTLVELAYRLILGREPESVEVLEEHARNCASIAELRAALVSSDEFRARFVDRSQYQAAPDHPSGIRFEIDEPVLVEGGALAIVSGELRIAGWALHSAGIASIEVHMDGELAGAAYHGMPRPDVAAANPGVAGAADCGYLFTIARDLLGSGDHEIVLRVRAKTGHVLERDFRVHCRADDGDHTGRWIRRRLPLAERAILDDLLRRAGAIAPVDLVFLDHPTADDAARRTSLRSAAAQAYASVRVRVLAPDEATAQRARAAAAESAAGAAVEVRVAGAEPLAAGSGKEASALLLFLHIGDELGCDAAALFALHAALSPGAGMMYADEVRCDPADDRLQPFFKPDDSPTLMLGMNYVGRPVAIRASIVEELGLPAGEVAARGLYDLGLRCIERCEVVHHVPLLLARTDGGWRESDESGAAALEAAMSRRGIDGRLAPGPRPGTWHVRRVRQGEPKVSIIVLTCAAGGLVRACLTSLAAKTAYRNFEVICVENIPAESSAERAFVRTHADQVVEMSAAFNWARFNNRGASVATGDYLLFLNDDVEIVEPDWLGAMLEQATREDVGVVGARLLYPHGAVQHAGMFLAENFVGRHAFRHAPADAPGYFCLARMAREVIAVTGACMMVRRDEFERLGGFDEAHEIVNNDLDFCLRVHAAGRRTVYTPHATLIHHERGSRSPSNEKYDAARFDQRWRGLFARGDPFFHHRLARYEDAYRIDDEGVEIHYRSQLPMARDEVRNLLVVKLDHIGDFVTAMPAIRRLKRFFRESRLTLLAAPASAALAQLEPAVDEFIAFEFYHAHSQLGEKRLGVQALATLARRLADHRFDLAIDLRKHLGTRPILQCSGAAVLAGYDRGGQYPWLDIALEMEGDIARRHKRHHIGDELQHLVAAVETAFTVESPLQSAPAPLASAQIPERARALFARRVVAIHPGAGNANKLWPLEHFMSLAGLLMERSDVNVLLLGGADEASLADAIVQRWNDPQRIASVAGQVSLVDLPRLLAACTMFIGNDSGPKHVAAAVGIPTIGIHSGVTSAREWMAGGPASVALARRMHCSPCYLERASDCPRGLACLRELTPASVYQTARLFLAPRQHATARAADALETRPAHGLAWAR